MVDVKASDRQAAAESGRKGSSIQFAGEWVIPVLIFIITMVVFIPTLQNGFVNWDDESFLVDNPHYRGLGWQQFRWMFTTCYLGSCMPLTM